MGIDNKIILACSIAELMYVNMMKKKQEFLEISEQELVMYIFPMCWNESTDYEMKLKFLKEAVSLNANLLDLPNIYIFEEGIELEQPKSKNNE